LLSRREIRRQIQRRIFEVSRGGGNGTRHEGKDDELHGDLISNILDIWGVRLFALVATCRPQLGRA
jgi:hypothetical protein